MTSATLFSLNLMNLSYALLPCGVFFFCIEEGRVKREEKWYAAKGGIMGKRRGEGGPM